MIKQTIIPGVLIVEGGPTFEDERGFFREPFRRDEFETALGKPWIHLQENHAFSIKNVLRGIHVAPWDKLIYVPYGRVLITLVDLRPDSQTYKQHLSLEIGDSNRVKVYIPAYVGNSYLVLSDQAVYEYQVSQYYQPGLEKGIAWNDPDLAITWPISDPLLSTKDQQNPSLQTYLESSS